MEEYKNNFLLNEIDIDDINIKMLNNETENLGELTAHIEFNIVVIGKEGKYIIFINNFI